jgi:hypothetical protein
MGEESADLIPPEDVRSSGCCQRPGYARSVRAKTLPPFSATRGIAAFRFVLTPSLAPGIFLAVWIRASLETGIRVGSR